MMGAANLGPYHISRFRELAKSVEEFTYIRVFFKESYRPWADDVKDICFRIIDYTSGSDLRKIFSELRPDIIFISGYNAPALLRGAYLARQLKIPTVLQSDTIRGELPRCKLKEIVKFCIIKYLFNAAYVTGRLAGEYISGLGIPEKFIWYGIYVVDNEYFGKKSSVKPRISPGFPDKYFFTAARLSPEKNLKGLLRAYKLYKNKGGEWGLVIAGTGPEENQLKQYAYGEKELRANVLLAGWVSYRDLPSLYQNASCFILPSIREPWGVVVNEAMAAGLPILISEKCGCVPELCRVGINGFAFNPHDIDRMSGLMLKMSSGGPDLDEMGRSSKKIINGYTPRKAAETVMQICGTLLSKAG